MQKYGIIFDMDGVISDTQKNHRDVELEILSSYDIITLSPQSQISLTTEIIDNAFQGEPIDIWMEKLFTIHGKGNLFNIKNIRKQKGQLLQSLYKSGNIQAIPGSLELIDQLQKSQQYILALFTASHREFMENILKKLSIYDHFDITIAADDIDPTTQKRYKEKGSPDTYNTIMSQYDLNDFIMIEDGASGMNGAIKAGGKAIAILGNNNPDKFPQAISHHKNLSTLTMQEIETILTTQ